MNKQEIRELLITSIEAQIKYLSSKMHSKKEIDQLYQSKMYYLYWIHNPQLFDWESKWEPDNKKNDNFVRKLIDDTQALLNTRYLYGHSTEYAVEKL